MTSKRDKISGKFIREFSDERFIQAIKQYEIASTREIANTVGCSINLANIRLRALRKDGRIKGRLVGRSQVWWLKRPG